MYGRWRGLGSHRFGGVLARPAWVPAGERPDGRYWGAEARGVHLFGRWYPRAADWHTDPVHGVKWPSRTPTRQIPIRTGDRPGDVQYVWVPSRFYHLFDRPDEAAADVAAWIRQNPPRYGVHWDNALEASARVIQWSFADGAGVFDSVLRPRVHSALWHHGRFIVRRLSRRGYNHRVGDAAGLVALGVSYPAMPGASDWRATGQEALHGEIERQILPDGSHVEQSPAYARFVADFYLLSGFLLHDKALSRAAERILDALLLQATPDADHPGYGDDDGATVLWNARGADRLAISLGVAGTVLDRPDFRAAGARCAGRVDEILRRVHGTRAQEPGRWDRPRSAVLPDAGVAVHSAGTQWVLFKCGPLGASGHGHADALSVLARGPVTLLDPGTPTYNGDDELRRFSTGTAAHNSVCIDGISQAERTGRFRRGELAGELVSVEDDGTRWSARGRVRYGRVEHSRLVVAGAGHLRLEDRVGCPGEHEATVRLLGVDTAPRLEGWELVRDGEAAVAPEYGGVKQVREIRLRARFRDRLVASMQWNHG